MAGLQESLRLEGKLLKKERFAMLSDRIGEAAGAVWQKLREAEKGCTVTELKKISGFTTDEVVAAVGWLAREDKIDLCEQRKKTIIRLSRAEHLC